MKIETIASHITPRRLSADLNESTADSAKRTSLQERCHDSLGSVRVSRLAQSGVALMVASSVLQKAQALPLGERAYYDNNNSNQCNANWYSALRYKYIYFQPPGNSSMVYEIATRNIINYPKTIADALAQEGLQVLSENPVGSCGWNIYDKVWATGIERGWIEYHPSQNLLDAPDANVTRTARNVLINNYPKAEIGVAVGLGIGLPVAVLVGVVLVVCLR